MILFFTKYYPDWWIYSGIQTHTTPVLMRVTGIGKDIQQKILRASQGKNKISGALFTRRLVKYNLGSRKSFQNNKARNKKELFFEPKKINSVCQKLGKREANIFVTTRHYDLLMKEHITNHVIMEFRNKRSNKREDSSGRQRNKISKP